MVSLVSSYPMVSLTFSMLTCNWTSSTSFNLSVTAGSP